MKPTQYGGKRPMHLYTTRSSSTKEPQHAPVRTRQGFSLLVLLALLLAGCHRAHPPDEGLPVFIPSQLPPFDCAKASTPPRPDDPKAKAWFDEAFALRHPSDESNIDFARIKELREKAAKRHYWPAVRAQLKGKNGDRNFPTIERAMLAGEPEAFFIMGELYMNGDGVNRNTAKAYALWQRAATMGDVRAMVKLAEVLSTKQDNSIGWDMANFPVATSMLECAMKKGFGDAAVALGLIILKKKMPDGTFAWDRSDVAEMRRLAILQEGAKLGSRAAVDELYLYFLMRYSFSGNDRPSPDQWSPGALRARYYKYLGSSLDTERPERLQNLDVAVPLPPKDLPDWRNKEDVIVGLWEAATGSSGEASAATPNSVK